MYDVHTRIKGYKSVCLFQNKTDLWTGGYHKGKWPHFFNCIQANTKVEAMSKKLETLSSEHRDKLK